MTRDTDGGGPTDRDLSRLLQNLTVESDKYAERFGAVHGLHRTDVNALVLIMEAARIGEPLSPSALAKELGLSPSATTALVDRLEALGHVERTRPAADRRRVADEMVTHLAPSARNKGCTRVEVSEPLASAEPSLWKRHRFASRGRTLGRPLGRSIG